MSAAPLPHGMDSRASTVPLGLCSAAASALQNCMRELTGAVRSSVTILVRNRASLWYWRQCHKLVTFRTGICSCDLNRSGLALA